MIVIKKITLENFLSHLSTSISFSVNDQMLLDGNSGAGKSSIFDAIVWCLYGQGRVDNRSLIRRGQKKASVILELVNDQGEPVVITRTVTASGKHTLEVTVKDQALALTGVRGVQEWIEKDLIGASYLLFINSVAYVQGNTESFVEQTATKRKELLLEIVKAEDYDKYYEKARKTLSGLQEASSRLEGQLYELSARLKAAEAAIGDPKALAEKIEILKAKKKGLDEKRKELEGKRYLFATKEQNIRLLKSQYEQAHAMAKRIEDVIGSNEAKIQQKTEIDFLINVQRPEILEKMAKNSQSINEQREILNKLTDYETKRYQLMTNRVIAVDHKSEIDFFTKSIKDSQAKEKCPAGDDCPWQSKLNQTIKFGEEKIAELMALSAVEATKVALWQQQYDSLGTSPGERRPLETRVHELENANASLRQRLYDIDLKSAQLDRLMEIEKELPGLKEDLESKNKEIQEYKKQFEEAEAECNPQQATLLANELVNTETEIEMVDSDIAHASAELKQTLIYEKESFDIKNKIAQIIDKDLKDLQGRSKQVALVKDAFGSAGIRTLVIDYLLPRLEENINQILRQLSDFRVRLDTQRTSADGETKVEGLFITILNEINEEMPYEAYSGGEKLKISVAISEALATLQKVGFRLFDETFLGLDENSTEAFAKTLHGLQKQFSQVLCISHLLPIKDLFDKKVYVQKRCGISTLTNS